jgi:hypothetical protein
VPYFDLAVLLDRETLDPNTLASAITATFTRRGMTVPADTPIGLTDEFATDTTRQALWQAFLKKNKVEIKPLSHVVTSLRTRLQPILNQAALKALPRKQKYL